MILLFYEKANTGQIVVRKFYLRRMMRIWPLYYLIVFICFICLPPLLGPNYFLYTPPLRSIQLVLFLFPNLVGPLGPLGHLWSIGLEEQFYLIWPRVLKEDSGIFLRIAFGIVILKLLLAPVIAAFQIDSMLMLFNSLRFECMAIGAIGAFLYYEKHPLLKWAYHPIGQGFSFGSIVYFAVIDIPLNSYSTFFTSLIFIVIILNLATNPASWLQLDTPLSNLLGQMSYGIYMYHFPLLYVVIFTLRKMGVPEGGLFDFYLYTITIGGTLFFAYISYRWFETPFLRKKSQFTVIQSHKTLLR